jgi:hypothetical protein
MLSHKSKVGGGEVDPQNPLDRILVKVFRSTQTAGPPKSTDLEHPKPLNTAARMYMENNASRALRNYH